MHYDIAQLGAMIMPPSEISPSPFPLLNGDGSSRAGIKAAAGVPVLRVSTELQGRRGGGGFDCCIALAHQLWMKSASALWGTCVPLCFRWWMNGISQDSARAASEVHIHQHCYVTITTRTVWHALQTRGRNTTVSALLMWPSYLRIAGPAKWCFSNSVTSHSSENESMCCEPPTPMHAHTSDYDSVTEPLICADKRAVHYQLIISWQRNPLNVQSVGEDGCQTQRACEVIWVIYHFSDQSTVRYHPLSSIL